MLRSAGRVDGRQTLLSERFERWGAGAGGGQWAAAARAAAADDHGAAAAAAADWVETGEPEVVPPGLSHGWVREEAAVRTNTSAAS
jgi:hypothetical protein